MKTLTYHRISKALVCLERRCCVGASPSQCGCDADVALFARGPGNWGVPMPNLVLYDTNLVRFNKDYHTTTGTLISRLYLWTSPHFFNHRLEIKYFWYVFSVELFGVSRKVNKLSNREGIKHDLISKHGLKGITHWCECKKEGLLIR